MIGESKTTAGCGSFRSLAGPDVWIAVAAALLFGGVAGAWYAPAEGDVPWEQALRLACGVVALALAVASTGTLICGRNAIRWGVGMPLVAYLGGTLIALASHPVQAIGLLLGAPVFAGLTIATGLLTAYLVDGLARSRRHS